jgi:hypothetical protein
MPEQQKKKELDSIIIVLMIVVAFFFDVLQWFLDFLFMGWLVTIFAHLTFFLWFRGRGVNFYSRKRIGTLSFWTFLDFIPVAGAFSWTFMVGRIALDYKIKKIIPGSDIIKRK